MNVQMGVRKIHRRVRIRAVPPGGCGGGVTPPKKSKIGGPNLRGGGPDQVELQNLKKMKESLAENVEKFWNLFCGRF